MEADGELLPDEPPEASGRPQLGGEAVIHGVVGQPAQGDLFLGGGEFGRPTGRGPRRQPGRPPAGEGGDPPADAARVNAEEVGNLLGGIPLADALNGEAPPTLQFRRCALGSHPRPFSKRRATRTLLT
jgi:hypothetical protein